MSEELAHRLRAELDRLPASASKEPIKLNGHGQGKTPPIGVDTINRDHFVTRYGARTTIVRVEHDDVLNRTVHRFLREADVKLFYGNRFVAVGKGRMQLGTYWLRSPGRRSYDRMILAPGKVTAPNVYNLWRGWGMTPKAGQWSLIREHLFEVICRDNPEQFAYFVKLLAACVQHPAKPLGVAFVMRGKKGAGKGLVARLMRRFFASHAVHIANSRHLTGHFNGHLLDALFVYADEAFWAGDKQGEGILKMLISEDTIPIEPKGVDLYQAPNMIKLFMASNAAWVVPVTADERRFFIVDVSDKRCGDFAYFTELAAAIDSAEGEAFLHCLLNMDLSGFDVRDIPDTKAMATQKLRGGDSVQKWWFDCLENGAIDPTQAEWPGQIYCSHLQRLYRDWCRDNSERHPESVAELGKRLFELCPDGKMEKARLTDSTGRPRVYKPASLQAHRDAFLKAMKIDRADYDWHHER